MGKPKFNWREIPLIKELDINNLKIKIIDKSNIELIGGIAVNIGNPHLVFFVNDLELFNLEKIGPQLEKHEYFPEKCNVTLAKIINQESIKVKVWERGAGLTKACGTAACAVAIAAERNGLAKKEMNIKFEQGDLSISINKENIVKMKGPVSNIEKIKINI